MKMRLKIMVFMALISMFLFSAKAYASERQKLNILLNVPYYHQIKDLNDESMNYAAYTACGPTSLAIMLKNTGMDIDVNDVLKVVPNYVYIPKVGFVHLNEGAKYFGKEAVEIEYSIKNIYEALDQGHPVFLNIQNYENSYGHGVVIVGMRGYDGEKADSLIIHDVWTGPYKEFKFKSETVLSEPEKGYSNYITTSNLFYIK